MKRDDRPWKETAGSLSAVKAFMFDGPGDEVLIVVRGRRSRPTNMTAPRRARSKGKQAS